MVNDDRSDVKDDKCLLNGGGMSFMRAACCRTLLAACPAVPTVMRTGCSKKSAAKRSILGGMVAENKRASAADTLLFATFRSVSGVE